MRIDKSHSRSAVMLLAALLAISAPARAATATDSVVISSDVAAPAVGQAFTVTITLTSGAGFSVWGHALTWNTAKIRLNSQPTITSPFGLVVSDSRTLPEIQASGEVRTGGYYEAAGPTYPNNTAGTGAIARFTFTRIAAGSAALACPSYAAGTPFGLVLYTATGTQRLPTASTLTLTDTSTSQVATPSVSPAAGTFTSAQSVTLSSSTAGAAIHYTIDGSTPSAASPTYTAAITIATTATLTAIATKSGMSDSAVATATFTISASGGVAPITPPASSNGGGGGCGLGSGLALLGTLALITRRRAGHPTPEKVR